MPSMRGISTSSVMTSGISSCDAARRRRTDRRPRRSPRSRDPAPGHRVRVWRTLAESSMIRTRIFLLGVHRSAITLAGTRCWRPAAAADRCRSIDFGMAEEQIAAGRRWSHKPRQHACLGRLVEIDQHVAAEDDVAVARRPDIASSIRFMPARNAIAARSSGAMRTSLPRPVARRASHSAARRSRRHRRDHVGRIDAARAPSAAPRSRCRWRGST